MAAPKETAALLPDMRQATRMEFGSRALKMLRPICKVCQSGGNVPLRWMDVCPHDPYVTFLPVYSDVPRYEPLDPDRPQGAQKIVGVDKVVEYRSRPNWVAVTLDRNVNRGMGVERGFRKGFILPTDLRSPSFPGGIAPVCQFRECYWQKDLKEYTSAAGDIFYGVFCRLREAQLVAAAYGGKILEYNNTLDPISQEIRGGQLESMKVVAVG